MASTKKSIIAGIALIGGLVSLVSLCRRASGPAVATPPPRQWKCTKCGKVFPLTYAQLARLRQPHRQKIPARPDPWAIPVLAPKGKPPALIETVPCPACGEEAHRYLTMRCEKCGQDFHWLEDVEPVPGGPKGALRVKRPVCPACGSTKATPR